jgi:hypothetical protein
MTRGTPTCDDCGQQTWGGPCIHHELWATIVTTLVPVVGDPEQPFLFPVFQYVNPFLCTQCIERRLGRQLTQEDLTICAWNAPWIESEVHRRHGDGTTAAPPVKTRPQHKRGHWPNVPLGPNRND